MGVEPGSWEGWHGASERGCKGGRGLGSSLTLFPPPLLQARDLLPALLCPLPVRIHLSSQRQPPKAPLRPNVTVGEVMNLSLFQP